MDSKNISSYVIKRLPRYYRFLGDLSAAGIKRISSGDLARRMGLTASQIRQDFNCFGGFGQQGYGYNTDILREEIGNILGINQPKKLIVVGMGNLGKAVTLHVNFKDKGFNVIGLFDAKESLVGTVVRNIPIRSTKQLDEFCKENHPDAAILAIPREAVHTIAEHLIRLGVRSFLNFSHYDLNLHFDDIEVENVHLGDNLMKLSYKIDQRNNK